MTTRPTVSAEAVTSAHLRIEASLFTWPVLEAIVARREADAPQNQDPARAAALATELLSFAGPDGSWGGDVLWTAESLMLLHELAVPLPPAERALVDASVAWILSRAGEPGRFAASCDPMSHQAGLCEHAVSGFFAVAPPDADLTGVTLAAGGRFPSDSSARFGISCYALRALLAWHVRDLRIDTHLASLRTIVSRHSPVSGSPIDVAAYALGVGAVAEAFHSEPDRVATLAGLTRLAALQRGDGSWPGIDLFHVLDVLIRALRVGHHLDAAEAAVTRSVGILSLMAGPDGSWGRGTGPERSLIGWRAFHRVANEKAEHA